MKSALEFTFGVEMSTFGVETLTFGVAFGVETNFWRWAEISMPTFGVDDRLGVPVLVPVPVPVPPRNTKLDLASRVKYFFIWLQTCIEVRKILSA